MPRGAREGQADFDSSMAGARERIAMAGSLLRDADRSLFALVTIPEAMSVLESRRTLEYLGRHDIPVGVVIANMVQPASETCAHCRARREIHLEEISALEEAVGRVPLRRVEASPRVIRGADELAELGRRLWSQKVGSGLVT